MAFNKDAMSSLVRTSFTLELAQCSSAIEYQYYTQGWRQELGIVRDTEAFNLDLQHNHLNKNIDDTLRRCLKPWTTS